MRIAILGATSQIAKDLVLSFSVQNQHDLALYARRPGVMVQWLASVELHERYTVADLKAFSTDEHFDAIINFVGVGNPAQAAALGASIFDVTLKYDELALGYLRQHPECRYIFLSSGAAYGSTFDEPADENTKALVSINNLKSQDWYGVAKLHAECRHRALSHFPIVDIRVFNYFSRTQDISARYLITDILRAILSGETLVVSSDNIIRDYIGPDDFCQLVSLILDAPATNHVIDCYTRMPVDKMTLLLEMSVRFGLAYKISDAPAGVNATGVKMNYFSRNHGAKAWGYSPSKSSLDNVLDEARVVLGAINSVRTP